MASLPLSSLTYHKEDDLLIKSTYPLQTGSLVAGTLHFLSRLSAITGAVGAALLSGVRVDQALSLTNRVFEAKDDPLGKSALSKYLLQLGNINKLRNELLHHGGHLDWVNEDKQS